MTTCLISNCENGSFGGGGQARELLHASQLDVIAIKRKGSKREPQLILMHNLFSCLRFRSFFSDIFQVLCSLSLYASVSISLSFSISFYICRVLKNTSQLCELLDA